MRKGRIRKAASFSDETAGQPMLPKAFCVPGQLSKMAMQFI
jgi:hypothetical protein